MQKIKKALKSLAKLGSKKPVKVSAPAAKAAKKKVTSATVKKKAAPAKKAAAPAKKAAPVKAAAGKKAPVAATAKKAAAPAKGTTAKAGAAKADPKAKKATAVTPVTTAKAAAPAKKVETKEAKKKPDAVEAKADAKADKKKAKAPRDEDEIPEIDDMDDVVVEETDGPVAESAYAEPESDEVVLTDAEGRRYCRVKDCDQISVVDGYCRYHYLLLWKKIQVRKKILSEGKLERYIEDLTARYPDKYLEMLRKDLRNEKDFMAAIHELEIDESASESEFEDESNSYAEEIRGMSSETPARDDDEF